MKGALLHKEVQVFLKSYEGTIADLAFKGSPFKGITVQELMQQLDGYRRTKKKLPSWHQTAQIYFPPKLNIEQTSSEITARYKASLVKGKLLADITGGFGVDSFYFAQRFEKVFHFELNTQLSQITAHNFKVLGIENIQCSASDGLEAIRQNPFDTIYVDPARRHADKGKVFFLSDCEPNVPMHLETLMNACETLLVKTSPMLDLSIGLKELSFVREIHVVAVDNEVKEVLWILRKGANETTTTHTINFTKTEKQFFSFDSIGEGVSTFQLPSSYLYEPNAAILKAGGFNNISEAFNLKKLHPHSHLYTNDVLICFPGRIFKIEKVIPYQKKELKKQLQLAKANITTRNFPESVAQLRKKWKIKDGGDSFLFFTTQQNEEKIVLVCSKLN